MTAPGQTATAHRPRPKYDAEGLESSQPIDNSRLIAADRVITGIVESGVNTQLDGSVGGPVVIQVSRNVFGYHGRTFSRPRARG